MLKNNIQERISNSTYLSRIETDQLKAVQGLDEPSEFTDLLESLIAEVKGNEIIEQNIQQCQDFLLDVKSKFAYVWSVAQLRKQLSFESLGTLLSQFADVTIDCALRAAWFSQDLSKVSKASSDQEEGVPGLFVIGLGKLGGWDLNFSSDVDLVAFYDEDKLPISAEIDQSAIVDKVLQEMEWILSNDQKPDFVWRVDWQLRPDAPTSFLGMSTALASDFYYYRALPWHRLAMLKARVVAGDHAVANNFLVDLQSFLWRQNLDFSAIDELAHMKKRINLEHPNLKHQRQQTQSIEKDCAGFNVKLGNGGIREIEFIVNGLQLLWGGKKPLIRQTNTLKSLENIALAGLLEEIDVDILKESYYFFRDLENHLQMLANVQTHEVPTEEQIQKQLISFRSGFEVTDFASTWTKFGSDVLKHRLQVHQLFVEFFKSETATQPDPYELPENWNKKLNKRSIAIIENWSSGFTQYGAPANMTIALEPLAQQLLAAVFGEGLHPDADKWLLAIDEFLSSQTNAIQYFQLLINHPALINSIVPPLKCSPLMAKLLKQSPHIVDNLVGPEFEQNAFSRLQFYEQQITSIFVNKDYGVRLEGLRRYVNENLYESYLSFMQGKLTVKSLQMGLTRIAECTLQAALEIARQELKLSKLPMVILGMGKLAVSRMLPLSDLDLVFIFEDGFDLEMAHKVASRLQTILSMELKEGTAYELDTRLRPSTSGRWGPPIMFLSDFRVHHELRAKNWEHIALLPSRIVAGDIALGKEVIQAKHDIYKRRRSQSQWLKDVIKMWNRVETQRTNEVISATLRPGGLIQAEYLAACLCVEQLSEPEFFETNQRFIDRFNYLLKNAQNSHSVSENLLEPIEFWSTVQVWERLLGLDKQAYEDMPKHFQVLMCQQLDCDSMQAFYRKVEKITKRVEHVMQVYFSSCDIKDHEREDWQETEVEWV